MSVGQFPIENNTWNIIWYLHCSIYYEKRFYIYRYRVVNPNVNVETIHIRVHYPVLCLFSIGNRPFIRKLEWIYVNIFIFSKRILYTLTNLTTSRLKVWEKLPYEIFIWKTKRFSIFSFYFLLFFVRLKYRIQPMILPRP